MTEVGREASPPLATARAAYARRDWITARDAYDVATREGDLDADDLYAQANCSWWLGSLERALPVLEAAYDAYLATGRPRPAALAALDIGYSLALRGEEGPGAGWTQRAADLLAELPAGVEHGFLRYVEFETAFDARDLDAAWTLATVVVDLGERHEDPTLRALGILARGRILIRRGRVADGLPLLDAAMVAATSDDLDPAWAGNIYCHLMSSCAEIADLRRAGEWTELTARWCESMPGAGPFLGICRVHRAEILCTEGAWDRAERELSHVVEGRADFDLIVIAEAHYQTGELHRLRGRFADAEAAYRAAHGLGRDPQPGRALLALAQGRGPAAAASLQAALAAATDPLARAPLLPAAAEIATAVRDLALGELAATELEELADGYGTLGFQAQAAMARGRLALLQGEAGVALRALTLALHAWQRQRAPFEVARTRLLLAQSYERVGDRDTARLEREAAAASLRRLGARIREEAAPAPQAGGLTPREGEVLLMVAAGRTNQQIADELVLSVRTVERHLATVYQKLDLHGASARAAAVSHALRHGLVTPH